MVWETQKAEERIREGNEVEKAIGCAALRNECEIFAFQVAWCGTIFKEPFSFHDSLRESFF